VSADVTKKGVLDVSDVLALLQVAHKGYSDATLKL
jgi:hypothetical protein